MSQTSSSQELSLWSAIIINVNIIIGSGVFINTAELAKRAGVCSALSYAIVGLLLFPLILSFARLLQLYPKGGFYSFCSKTLHPSIGFLSTWCYFATKMSSATLVIHIFVLLMQKTFPFVAHYNPFFLDVSVLAAIVGLNMFNVQTSSTIQKYLMILKLFPIFLVIVSGIFFLNWNNLSAVHQLWEGVPATIPLVLHAMLGFETACSISRNIKNSEVNAPRAVLISYGLVILLYVTFQGMVYAILGSDLTAQTDYRGVFPLLISKFGISEMWRNFLGHFIHMAIAMSALSAGFGMIFANMWNLYSLAELKHIFGSTTMMRLNKYNIPFLCVLAEGFISFTYMCLMRGEQTTFQQLSGLGATITYSLSILGLLVALMRKNKGILIPILGLINCAILFSASAYTMWWSGNSKPLIIITTIIGIGMIMYWGTEKENKRNAF